MNLENSEDKSLHSSVTPEKYQTTMIKCIKLTFEFLRERINECPAFIHILDQHFNEVICDPTDFIKNDDHSCCIREFLDQDLE